MEIKAEQGEKSDGASERQLVITGEFLVYFVLFLPILNFS
jgi:hypothetical protein